MFRTIIFAGYLWITFLLSLILLVPYAFLTMFRLKEARESFIRIAARIWARHILWAAGGRITVEGAEHVPRTGKICFVANHQGMADIPLLYGYAGRRLGIIAKKELGRIPIINIWINALGCILIDRKSPSHAHKAIELGINRIRNGVPMAIFPEGTRSKGPKPGVFRPGSLKLATRSGAAIIPITIDGSYKLLEEHNRITPADVRIVIHEPVPTEHLSTDEQKELPGKLFKIIESAL